MRTNTPAKSPPQRTHEGAPATRVSALSTLRRQCLSALLFEDQFYTSGSTHAADVAALVAQCAPADVAALALECRRDMHLRHTPLFLVRELARVKGQGALVAAALEAVINRPDELTEYLALYWREGKQPISAGSKRGLARAFKKFTPYALAKYNQKTAIKLRDVLRLVHSKPDSAERSATWKALIAGELLSPDTWEVALSSGADKRDTFERLLREKKLGGLAFLRNLRNMINAGVDDALIRARFAEGFPQVLPFRFIAASRYAPDYVREIEQALLESTALIRPLTGSTTLLVDVSASMDAPVSARSDMTRLDAACALAIILRAGNVNTRVFTFSGDIKKVPAYEGLALAEAVSESQPHGSTYLGSALRALRAAPVTDRLVVVTDEQSADRVDVPMYARAYMINVAAYKNGVGYGRPWIHIDGWSERVLDFIHSYEHAE